MVQMAMERLYETFHNCTSPLQALSLPLLIRVSLLRPIRRPYHPAEYKILKYWAPFWPVGSRTAGHVFIQTKINCCQFKVSSLREFRRDCPMYMYVFLGNTRHHFQKPHCCILASIYIDTTVLSNIERCWYSTVKRFGTRESIWSEFYSVLEPVAISSKSLFEQTEIYSNHV